jgi:hypothetical protein
VAAGPLKLVVNGNLGQAVTVQPGPDGRWQAELTTGDLLNEGLRHRVIAWRPADGQVSAAQHFRVQHQWLSLADMADPADDDHGPAGAAQAPGAYRYPTDASFVPRTLDLRRVRVEGAAGALRLHVDLAAMSQSWNPANGFDHLALTVFIELPGQAEAGQRAMPLQTGDLPGDLRWHRRLRLHGWSNALFSASGSGPQHEGKALTPGATLRVDAPARRITLTLPASALGHADLRGARLWLNTWDWDSTYRSLSPQALGHGFGGGDGSRQPLWMDASEIITLPP